MLGHPSQINLPAAVSLLGSLVAFVLGKTLETSRIFLRFFLRTHSRSNAANKTGLGKPICVRCLAIDSKNRAGVLAIHKRSSLVCLYVAIVATVTIDLIFTLTGLAVAQSPEVGIGPTALPAVDRVGHAGTTEERIAGSLSTDYGYAESVLDANDEHHRLQARIAASLVPIEWLALALRFDGRYDSHSIENQENDDGLAGETRLAVRASYEINDRFRLGGESVLRVPGGKTPGDAISGTSLDLDVIGSLVPGPPSLLISSLIGFRLDNSANAIEDADRMSLSDRLALNVSETNAILLGLAESWRVGEFEVLGEWTWDIYFGESAPSAIQSPMRFVVGARWWQSTAFQLSALLGITPSSRPTIDASSPHMVVEPRFWIGVSAQYTLPLRKIYGSEKDTKIETGSIPGRVLSTDGSGIAMVQIDLSGTASTQTVSDTDGAFRLDNVPTGNRSLTFRAPGWQPKTVSISVSKGANQPIEIVLEPAARSLQGTVYTPSKEPIPNATVWVGKGDEGIETQTDDAGRFELRDFPEDADELRIKATGWEEYTKVLDDTTDTSLEIEIALERPLPEGQIRGYIRSFGGKPLTATIVIEPIGMRLRTGADGTFQADVPPGSYRVTVRAPGHRTQKRSVQVEQKGVTVLVVDLLKKRR